MDDRRRQLLESLLAIHKARDGLLDFAAYICPNYDTTPHHIRALAAKLEEVEAGKIDRLMVAMPPQHGKSWLCSQIFPLWCMARQEGVRLATASYAADRAEGNSKSARALARDEAFLRLYPALGCGANAKAMTDRADEWNAGKSSYKAVGVGGGLTGFPVDGMVMDDLLQDWAEAQSPTQRQKVWDWYCSVVMSRNPRWQIMVATRWHPDDPSGRMLKAEPDRWHVVNFRALEGQGDDEKPLWDCPKFGLDNYRKIRAVIGRTQWAALYQQEPTISGGNVFKVAGVRECMPEDFPQVRYVRAWDLASSVKQRTGSDPDWTVGVLGAVTKEQDHATGAMLPHLWIRDVVFIRAEAPQRNAKIKATADMDGNAVRVAVEAFGAYKDAAAELRLALAGTRIVVELRPPGDKAVKAAPLEPIFERGNVHVPKGAPWLAQWLTHFEEFPAGAHDDAVDATALVWHEQAAPKAGLAL